MNRFYATLLFSILFSTLWLKSGELYAQTTLMPNEWSDFDDSSDAYLNKPENCAILFSPWDRGSGIAQVNIAINFFDSRKFNSNNYAIAVDSQDYIYFTIVTDPYTSLSIQQFIFKTSISKTVDTADVVFDYGNSLSNYAFSIISSYVDTNHFSVGLHTIILNPAIEIPAQDSTVFRLVIATDFHNDNRTFKFFGGSIAATYSVDLTNLTAQISSSNSYYCYDNNSSITVPVNLSGAPNTTVYFKKDGIPDSVFLNSSGLADLSFITTVPNSGTYHYQLDSIRNACYSKILNQNFSVTVYPPIPALAVSIQ